MCTTLAEKRLAETLLLIQIKGKRGRKVPILFPQDARQAIDFLLKYRSLASVPAENKFLFILPNHATHLRGWDGLSTFAKEFGCKQPKLVTGTNLRKYLATTVQVIDLAENEIDWLARHLGHDIRVHQEFYRKHESVIELAKISQLLYHSERGSMRQNAGKKLEHLKIDQEIVLDGPEVQVRKSQYCQNHQDPDEVFPTRMNQKW